MTPQPATITLRQLKAWLGVAGTLCTLAGVVVGTYARAVDRKVEIRLADKAMADELAGLKGSVEDLRTDFNSHLGQVHAAMGPDGDMGRRFNWLVESNVAVCKKTGAACPDATEFLKAR